MLREKTGKAPINLVVFDVGNVLIWFDLNRAAQNFDRWEPGKGQAIKKRIWCSPFMAQFETGRLSGRQLYGRLKKEFRLKMTYPQFIGAINDIFEPVRPNLALLQRLSRHVPTALLSNTNHIHWKHILKTYPGLKRAHWPFSSHLLHAMKPSPKIFRTLSRRTGVPLREMFFIDDRPENVAGARSLGIRSVRFTGRKPLREMLSRFRLFSQNGNDARFPAWRPSTISSTPTPRS